MTRDVCERDFSKENSHHLRKGKQWVEESNAHDRSSKTCKRRERFIR